MDEHEVTEEICMQAEEIVRRLTQQITLPKAEHDELVAALAKDLAAIPPGEPSF